LRKPTGLICRRTEEAKKNHRAAQTSSGKGKRKRRLPVFQIKPAIKFPADEKQLGLPRSMRSEIESGVSFQL
jgi:hypothetical protein